MLYLDDQIICKLLTLKGQLLGIVLQCNIADYDLHFVSDMWVNERASLSL